MITFHRLNEPKETRSAAASDRSKLATYEQLKVEAETLVGSCEGPVRLFFMDIESEVSEIVDQDDWDYAKSQPVPNLLVVVVEKSESRKGVALFDAIGELIKKIPYKDTVSEENIGSDSNRKMEEIDAVATQFVELKEPEKLQTAATFSCEVPPDNSTPEPEVPKGVQELGTILTRLHETVQENIKELAESLSPVAKEKPKQLAQSPLASSKPRPGLESSKERIVCNNCKKAIQGKRFKCLECSAFNLCADCETLVSHPHTMVRFNSAAVDGTANQLTKVYQLKSHLVDMTDSEMRRAIIKRVTSGQYPEEFYDQFVQKNRKLTFGEYVNKVVSIFE